MKITDLKIGEFATRNWYSGANKILYVKRFSEEKYEYWENGQFSSSIKKDSSIFNYNDFKLCDCNGEPIDESKPEFTYPMYFECIRTHSNEGMIVKFKTIEKGQIVKSGKKLGATKEFDIKGFTMHTDQKTWKQVNFDETICKIIPTQDDIDELISDLKSIIEDDDNRFSPSEYGAGTQLKESGDDQCLDLINEWMEKYYITKAPDIGNEKDFIYFDDLFYVVEYIKVLLYKDCNRQDNYASKQNLAYIQIEKAKSRLHEDVHDAIQYLINGTTCTNKPGATDVVKTNLNQIKENTMTKELTTELQEKIVEMIIASGMKPKKPKTPKIVCDVNGELMQFANEAALKQFMWSSRVESVIRYDLTGKVTVPFELSVEAPKKQKQTKVTV